ncbi:hypothetical protein MML48_1g18326 [Holotrichia oblita]|uniref:Uncharacterized protein n=1 Tax=Holotrichia oblita TaxID=644536 RepID=A0ACB9TYE1_HOLOL|nr:hypothetical protein MML48_1g18326 [Holotrichia oblita]
MANLKKRGPIRQFSLQCDSPKAPERRKSLIKQFSEDYTEPPPKPIQQELGIRVSLCNKNLTKKPPNEGPPPTKIAWSEKPPDIIQGSKDDAIIVKKCVDLKRTNSPRRLRKQSSLDTDSILYSRQDFAKRLEQAWKDREACKTNLNIILTHTTVEQKHDDVLVDVSNTVRPILNCDRVDGNKPKIILPLKPDLHGVNSESNMKNVFQKHIRRNVKQKSLFDDGYSPTRIYDRNEKPHTIIVPLMDAKTIASTNQNNKVNEVKQSSRPSTAASKRDMFQKRTNSAFHGSTSKKDSPSSSATTTRPPLLRTSSMPVKQDQPKPKFVATKRRVKTAKAKIKYEKEDFDEDCPSSGRRSALQRCVSVAGVLDVVTMVSLVSTSGSENEDEEVDDDFKEKSTGKNDANLESKVDGGVQKVEDEEKNFSLRKTVKSGKFVSVLWFKSDS